ncbi:Amidohydrolase family protein [Luminiphilus syltensis NOR5-1B]|uniref:Amidohydrolase family protein n=2 Tax=Luminiphilus TaxID=1341118 RepID=B8KTJ6_9GAMM|nr:Amidohydrolase family protein [Luminiphilus syltensis NOR5-1B]
MCILLATLAGVSLPAWAQWEASNRADLVIRGGWLFDSQLGARRANPGISIRDGRFVSVNSVGGSVSNAMVLELEDDDTLIPGMIDLHAHYNLDLVDKGRVEEVANNATVLLANGVTATWSAGEYYPERVIAQRDRIDAGEAIGPRLFASGPYFGSFRCEYNVGVHEDECIGWPNDITDAEIRSEVDYWAEQGVISIKIKQASPGEMAVLIDQAKRHRMTTAAHLANYEVEYDVELRDAILMGLDRVEHQLTLGSGGERSAEMPQMIEMMLTHQVYYDANLQMYGGILERRKYPEMIWADEARYFTPYARELLEKRGEPPPESDAEEYAQRVREVKALYDAGGEDLLIIGTDEPVYTSLLPGFAYHRELLAMSYAGIPNAAILKAATINGARALGIDDRVGSIEVGKLADLFVAKGDPLADIKRARDIRWVIKSGTVYDPSELLDSAEDSIGPAGPDDHAAWELKLRALREAN